MSARLTSVLSRIAQAIPVVIGVVVMVKQAYAPAGSVPTARS